VTQLSTTNKNSHCVLSGNNLIVTANSGGTAGGTGQADTGVTAGQKRYWEVKVTGVASGTSGIGVGIADSGETFSDGNYLGLTTHEVGYYPNGWIGYNGSWYGPLGAWGLNDVLCFAVDSGNKWWVRVNGGGWNNDVIANQNPATNTGGSSEGFVPCFPAYNLKYSTTADQLTFNFGDTSQVSVGSNSGIMWGINGHPGRSGVYTSVTIASQLALLDQMGLKIYRMDTYDASSATQTNIRNVINAAKPYGIKVLPILFADITITDYANETAAYNFAKPLGQTLATNFSDYIKIWEIGNEWNGKFGAVTGEGSFFSNYDPVGYAKMRGLARGFLDGIRAGDPTAKCAFGSNDGAAAWGWTDQLWADGVRWDIHCEHFYNDGAFDITALPLGVGTTNKLQLLKDHYGVPIWMTEHNYFESGGNTADSFYASYLATTMPHYDAIAHTYDLESVQIYELLDEAIAGQEGRYGICTGAGVLQGSGTGVSNYLAANPSKIYGVNSAFAFTPPNGFTAF